MSIKKRDSSHSVSFTLAFFSFISHSHWIPLLPDVTSATTKRRVGRLYGHRAFYILWSCYVDQHHHVSRTMLLLQRMLVSLIQMCSHAQLSFIHLLGPAFSLTGHRFSGQQRSQCHW